MQHYIDVVQDRSGNVIGGAIVVITDNSTGLPVTVYSDAGGSVVQPTVTTDVNGTFSFYVSQGRYNLLVTKNGATLKVVNDVDITGDYPTAMTLADAQAGTNPTTQTISASVLNKAVQYGAFTPAGTGAVTRTVASKLNDIVSVKDFGAVGDGVTDDTAAFNLAIATGKSIYVPSGNYLISSALTILARNQLMYGDGAWKSKLTATGNGYDVVTLASYYSSIDSIGFFATTYRTSGSYVTVWSDNTYSTYNNTISNFYMEAGAIGIHINGPTVVATIISNGTIGYVTPTVGIGILVDGGANLVIDNVLLQSNLAGGYPLPTNQPIAGIKITQHGGAFISNVSEVGFQNGLLIAPSTGQDVFACCVSNCQFDAHSLYGIAITPSGTGTTSAHSFTNVYVAGSNVNLYFDCPVGAYIDGIVFDNARILNGIKQGVYIKNVGSDGDIRIANSVITGSSLGFSGTYAHIEIANSMKNFHINNNMFGNFDGLASTALCGILIGTTCNSFSITDNYFQTGLTAIVDNSTGINKLITDNLNASVYYCNGLFNSVSSHGGGNVASNLSIGNSALAFNSTGSTNTALGVNALNKNTTGISNCSVGYGSLANNISGANNVVMGVNSLIYNTIGYQHTALGHSALQGCTTAVTTLGAITGGSGYTNGSYTGVELTYVSGSTALAYPTANITVAGGIVTACTLATNGVGFLDTTTVMSCASIGAGTGFAISPATLATANTNTAIGDLSGWKITTGSNNVILGSYSGLGAPISQTGSNYVVLSDGAGNVREYFDASGHAIFNATTRTAGYTVATLPTGVTGMRTYVTNALAPVWGSTVVTGGAITVPVFYNGTNWIVG